MYYDDNISAKLDDSELNSFMSKVYGWMFAGLFTTAITALALIIGIYNLPLLINFIGKSIFILPIVEIVLVFILSYKINSIQPNTAKIMFLIYSIVNGLTIGIVCLGFSLVTIWRAFFMTSLMFGAMSMYSCKTKSDMTKAGNIFKVGLVGLLIVSIVNLFINSSTLDWIICIVGMAVFLGLTAYDTRKIKQYYYAVSTVCDTATVSKFAIIGALELYLDFINLFLYIIRIFGKRNN